jgi:uncharacterized protein YbjT (DUF2867 family)
MKITVIGASGLIGTKVVDLLTAEGHDVVAASRASGVDVLTGDGLAEALSGADALVDVVNSPSFDDDPVMEFFTKSATNLVDAAKRAGVGHYVCLSIVGIDDLPDSGYMRAKVARAAVTAPLGGIVNIGGPEKISFEQMARAVLADRGEDKTVVIDPQAHYFGTQLAERSLVTPD